MNKTRPKDPNAISISDLIKHLEFSEEALAQALLDQPKFFYEAAKYRIQKVKARMQAEANLDQVRADTAYQIRTAETETKITEKYIEQEVERNEDVRTAQAAYNEAKAMEEAAKLLLDAYSERGSMAKALVQLIGAEAALESGFVRGELERMGIDRLKQKVKGRFPGTTE